MIYSKQRETILEELRNTKMHPTAEELFEMLRMKGEDISLATVYRNLGQLADAGMVLRLSGLGSSDRFDGDMSEHYHAVCRECGRTFDITLKEMPDLLSHVEAQDVIDVDSVNMLFSGTCKTCKNCREMSRNNN